MAGGRPSDRDTEYFEKAAPNRAKVKRQELKRKLRRELKGVPSDYDTKYLATMAPRGKRT